MTGYYEKLYEFQREDVDKHAGQRGFLDATDMGGGKTIKGVAIDEVYNPNGRTLVVCPAGVVQHWRQHFMQAHLPVVALQYDTRFDDFNRFVTRDNKVLVIHWQALQRRKKLYDKLREVKWGLIIADEVQYIQNRGAEITTSLGALKTPMKLGLSGTPATTNIQGYWSPLHWMYPITKTGGWGSYWNFVKRYCEVEETWTGYNKIVGPKNEDEFLERIKPYYVRHMKREQCCPHHPKGVMPWLPDKSFTIIRFDLPDKIRRAYEQMKKEMVAWVGEHENEPVMAQNFLAKMVRLVQFTGAFATVTPQGEIRLSEPSPKLDIAMDLISRSSRPIVVFSMYRQMIELLDVRLRKAGIPSGMYTGATKATREDDKASFIGGGLHVLGLTISAGGLGLDGLQQVCDTCIFLDRDWSPMRNVQAEDRLWRDGQPNAVNIIDIVSNGTVELGRRQNIVEKWLWLRTMLGDMKTIQEEAFKNYDH